MTTQIYLIQYKRFIIKVTKLNLSILFKIFYGGFYILLKMAKKT